jgi:sugar-specific transcriptional regulator TrmB
MLENVLSKFGLSTKEAKIYIALLELGASPVSDLAKKTDIKRSTAYVLLSSLMNRGLVSVTDSNSVRLYNPAPPERLVHYLEESARKYNQLIGVAKSILPELKSVYTGVGPKPKVQFFEGYEGIETAYEETLNATEEIRAYASINDMHAALPHYFPDYYKRRAARNISIRAIFPDTPESRERVKHNKEEKRTAYLVPKDQYSFSPEINIYDNKIVFMSLVEKFSLVIESKELADALKKSFELAWIAAQQMNKNNGRQN